MAGRPEKYLFCQHPDLIPVHFQTSRLSSRFPAVSNFYSKDNRGEYHLRQPGPAERNDQTCYNKNTISGREQQDGPFCKAEMPTAFPDEYEESGRNFSPRIPAILSNRQRADAKKSRKSGSSSLCKILYTSERGGHSFFCRPAWAASLPPAGKKYFPICFGAGLGNTPLFRKLHGDVLEGSTAAV